MIPAKEAILYSKETQTILTSFNDNNKTPTKVQQNAIKQLPLECYGI